MTISRELLQKQADEAKREVWRLNAALEVAKAERALAEAKLDQFDAAHRDNP